MQMSKLGSDITQDTKLDVQWITGLDVRAESLREKQRENTSRCWRSGSFFDVTQKSQATKGKWDLNRTSSEM